MTPVEIAAWIGGGAGVTGLTGAVVALLKARPEAKRLEADTARTLSEASVAFVQSATEDMQEMRAEIAALRTELRKLQERDVIQGRLLRIHERWDITVTDVLRDMHQVVPDPPPLYPDPTAAA